MSVNDFVAVLTGAYQDFANVLPESYRVIPALFFVAVIITLYSFFVYFFCKFIAKKDIIGLNLSQYNTLEHPAMAKLAAIGLYIFEFLVVIPIVILVWFLVFTIILIPMAVDIPLSTVFFLSASFVASIRITTYLNEDVSKQLAELFPFTLLFVLITEVDFYNPEMIIGRINQFSSFIDGIVYYILFIVALEFILRMIALFFEMFFSGNEDED